MRSFQILKELRTPGMVKHQHAGVSTWWKEHLDVFDCSIPDPAAQRQINTWNPINSVQAGRYSRAANALATGVRGIGIRDTVTDMLAIAYRKPDWAKAVFQQLLAHQYEDGRAVASFHPDEKRPHDTSLRCDTHLWLPFVAYALLAETGDLSLCQEAVPFLAGDNVSAAAPASIWEHLLAGVRFSEAHLGNHGITFQNPTGIEKGVKSILVDGTAVPAESLPIVSPSMLKGKDTVVVQVTMGQA